MKRYIPRLIGAGELQKKTAVILKEVAASEEESVVITHNQPQVVIMSIQRYEKLKSFEDFSFIPHQKSSPKQLRQSFEKTGRYSKAFLDDLEDGLKKSSLYL